MPISDFFVRGFVLSLISFNNLASSLVFCSTSLGGACKQDILYFPAKMHNGTYICDHANKSKIEIKNEADDSANIPMMNVLLFFKSYTVPHPGQVTQRFP